MLKEGQSQAGETRSTWSVDADEMGTVPAKVLLGQGLGPMGRVRGSPGHGQRQSGLPGSRQLQSYRENSQRNKKFMYSQPSVKGLEEKEKRKGFADGNWRNAHCQDAKAVRC